MWYFAVAGRIRESDAHLLICSLYDINFKQGRFHHVLHVPPPDASERLQLLSYFGRKCALDADTVQSLTTRLREGMSGAEVENLCREATVQKLHAYF
jgi:SpoVK/Ycf46/Vps4 family AAA+-type ATPase